MTIAYNPNPKFDLVLERVVDVTPNQCWHAWTRPEYVVKWFTPVPWKTVDCRIDLRPGGEFFTMMESPEGEQFPNLGCYLELAPNQKIVWTTALEPGYRPSSQPFSCGVSYFTAVITFEPHGKGTKYTAVAIHKDEEGRNAHESMGFQDGWGAALDQLVTTMKGS